MKEQRNIEITQQAQSMNGVVGYQELGGSDSPKSWHEKAWGKLVIGLTIAICAGLLLKWMVG